MADKKNFWDIDYTFHEDENEEKPKQKQFLPPLPVARGTKAHESSTLTEEEQQAVPLLPKRSQQLDSDDISRLAARPIKPGEAPK